MFWTVILVLLILWAIGLLSSYTFGGLIHILLVAAVIVLIIKLIKRI
ncbi:MAG: lmo0937 family membrane protein [Ignavibacteria bacterium]|nr:lmo0937 family membrane protein [Ignavibacteria bacterium]